MEKPTERLDSSASQAIRAYNRTPRWPLVILTNKSWQSSTLRSRNMGIN
jgi:hypothetical protein